MVFRKLSKLFQSICSFGEPRLAGATISKRLAYSPWGRTEQPTSTLFSTPHRKVGGSENLTAPNLPSRVLRNGIRKCGVPDSGISSIWALDTPTACGVSSRIFPPPYGKMVIFFAKKRQGSEVEEEISYHAFSPQSG